MWTYSRLCHYIPKTFLIEASKISPYGVCILMTPTLAGWETPEKWMRLYAQLSNTASEKIKKNTNISFKFGLDELIKATAFD